MKYVNIAVNGRTIKTGLADNFFSRFRGLMWTEITEGTSLLIVPCAEVHCFNMRDAIDVVYVDRSGSVISVQEGMKPNTVGRYVRGCYQVWELSSGMAGRLGVEPGVHIEIVTNERMI